MLDFYCWNAMFSIYRVISIWQCTNYKYKLCKYLFVQTFLDTFGYFFVKQIIKPAGATMELHIQAIHWDRTPSSVQSSMTNVIFS